MPSGNGNSSVSEQETSRSALLKVDRVTKRFVAVTALRDISIHVAAGEVHALCGHNGAGKSTLLRIISGVEKPDAGNVTVAGNQVRNAADARRFGIGMIHQELTLVPSMSVADNIFAGQLPVRFKFVVDKRALLREADRLLEEVGASFDSRTLVHDLSTPQRQLVEIAKARARSARLLVMDEPTASLGATEVEEVLKIVREAADSGQGVLYVSHRLDEVFAVADRITVLRDGEMVLSGMTSGLTVEDIVAPMVGRKRERLAPDHHETDVSALPGATGALAAPISLRPRAEQVGGSPGLEVEGLNSGGLLKDVSFSVLRGEIVGLAGFVGSGRTELARCIAGLDRIDSGSIRVSGRALTMRGSHDAARAGVVYAPEERKVAGLVLGMSIAENITLMNLRAVSRRGFLRPKLDQEKARAYIESLGVRPGNPRRLAGELSGGNQQKVVLAKLMASGATVLLLDEPTRGVDVGAKAEIYLLVRELVAEGKTVVFISSEFEELVGLCDRVLVLQRGRLVRELSGASISAEQITAAAATG